MDCCTSMHVSGDGVLVLVGVLSFLVMRQAAVATLMMERCGSAPGVYLSDYGLSIPEGCGAGQSM